MIYPFVKLSDLCSIITRGKAPKYGDSTQFNIVKSAQVQPTGVLWDECPPVTDKFGVGCSPTYFLQNGDVLLNGTGTGTLGRPSIVRTVTPNRFIPDSHINLLRANDDLNPLYLFYWFFSPRGQRIIELNHTGSTNQIELSAKRLSYLKIPLPPLPVQKKIAAILDAADSLRQKDKALIAKYTELSQSLFLEMFGDPAINKRKFKLGTIGDLLAEVKYGTSSKADENGEYPYLRMNNITYEGYMDFSNLKYITLSEKDKPKYLVRRGDLLFNRTNSKELVGKTGLYNSDNEMAIAGYLIRTRVNENANPYYIWGYLNSKHGKLTLAGMCKSIVGMANINAKEFQTIKILHPPIELQNQFAERIEAIEKQKKQAELSLQKSDDLFNSLMQKAFKGELVS